MDENILFAELLMAGFVDKEFNILPDKYEDMMNKYPEFNTGLQVGKVVNESKGKKGMVRIRPERFSEIKELWSKINQKYYLQLDEMTDQELLSCVENILDKDIYDKQMIYATERRTQKGKDGQITLKEEIAGYHALENVVPYNEFLKKIHKETGLPLNIIHEGLVKKNESEPLPQDFFNRATLQRFNNAFQEWLETAFMKRFSYRKLGVDSTETALTDIEGNVKESVIQGNVGMMKDDSLTVPSKFLFDSFVYDSPKERETIERSDIDEVVVFGEVF